MDVSRSEDQRPLPTLHKFQKPFYRDKRITGYRFQRKKDCIERVREVLNLSGLRL